MSTSARCRLSFQIVDADGNYYGSGSDDVLFVNQANDQVVMWTMGAQGQDRRGQYLVGFLPAGYVIDDATSDFNGDGKSDILIRSTTTGDVQLWTMNGPNIVSTTDLGSIGQNGRKSSTPTETGITIVADQSLTYYALPTATDTLIAEAGSPTLVGGAGADTFYINGANDPHYYEFCS